VYATSFASAMYKPKMETNSQLEDRIRGIINKPRKQYALIQDTAAWNMLCSCLDIIGDTELAIGAFLAKRKVEYEGERYILVYGALQALFIQQDAVRNLAEALNIEYDVDPMLKHIREIRNDSIGHPSKRGGGKGNAFNFIVRMSLSHRNFMLMTTYPNLKEPQYRKIDIPDLIDKQRESLTKVLTDVISKLEAEEMAHKIKFKDERLQDIFPPTIDYYFEKISGKCIGNDPLGAPMLESIFQIIEKFKTSMQSRGILKPNDNVSYYLELIEYPLTELKNFFDNPNDSSLNSKSAYIFSFFVHKKNTY
jgi:hypothetical protein